MQLPPGLSVSAATFLCPFSSLHFVVGGIMPISQMRIGEVKYCEGVRSPM